MWYTYHILTTTKNCFNYGFSFVTIFLPVIFIRSSKFFIENPITVNTSLELLKKDILIFWEKLGMSTLSYRFQITVNVRFNLESILVFKSLELAVSIMDWWTFEPTLSIEKFYNQNYIGIMKY